MLGDDLRLFFLQEMPGLRHFDQLSMWQILLQPVCIPDRTYSVLSRPEDQGGHCNLLQIVSRFGELADRYTRNPAECPPPGSISHPGHQVNVKHLVGENGVVGGLLSIHNTCMVIS